MTGDTDGPGPDFRRLTPTEEREQIAVMLDDLDRALAATLVEMVAHVRSLGMARQDERRPIAKCESALAAHRARQIAQLEAAGHAVPPDRVH